MAVAERDLSDVAPAEEPRPYRWTREQFYQMGDLGLFEGQRVMLLEGEILAMPAMGNRHRATVTLASDTLRRVFGDGFFVSVQSPFDVGQDTDPEPDIAVIEGRARDFVDQGLTQAALIVEVSDTTLDYDRDRKASLYAQARVEEYWIINLSDAQVEVHRRPVTDGQTFGGYREVMTLRAGQTVAPSIRPDCAVAVSDLLP